MGPVRGKQDDGVNLASPTKPTGILLTPGTGPSRRKTVSFGASIDQEDLRALLDGGNHNAEENVGGEDTSPLAPGSRSSVPEAQRTKLTKILYESQTKVSANSGDKVTSFEIRIPPKGTSPVSCVTLQDPG